MQSLKLPRLPLRRLERTPYPPCYLNSSGNVNIGQYQTDNEVMLVSTNKSQRRLPPATGTPICKPLDLSQFALKTTYTSIAATPFQTRPAERGHVAPNLVLLGTGTAVILAETWAGVALLRHFTSLDAAPFWAKALITGALAVGGAVGTLSLCGRLFFPHLHRSKAKENPGDKTASKPK